MHSTYVPGTEISTDRDTKIRTLNFKFFNIFQTLNFITDSRSISDVVYSSNGSSPKVEDEDEPEDLHVATDFNLHKVIDMCV